MRQSDGHARSARYLADRSTHKHDFERWCAVRSQPAPRTLNVRLKRKGEPESASTVPPMSSLRSAPGWVVSCVAEGLGPARGQCTPGPPYAAHAGDGCVPVFGLDTQDRSPCALDAARELGRSVVPVGQDQRSRDNIAPAPWPVLLRAVLDRHVVAVDNGRAVASRVHETSDRLPVARVWRRCELLAL